jgi:hypothetical protein
MSSVLMSIVGETPSQGDGGLSWLVSVSCKESYIINLSKLRTLPFLTLAHNQIPLLHLKQMLDKSYIINYNWWSPFDHVVVDDTFIAKM